MSADAVALFRPKDLDKLKPFLDLDEDSDESEGLYAEALDDGAVLVHTFQPFEVFEQNPAEAREWLAQFGDVLSAVHDDPRGLLFFPDTFEPDGKTYDAVVAEVAEEGIWIATGLVDEDEPGLPPIDMATLQAFAGQLLRGGEGESQPATSYDVARLFEGVQQQLLEALGMSEEELREAAGGELDEGGYEDGDGEDEDEEGEDDDEEDGGAKPSP
jgi:hypothetical protein